MQKNIFVKYGFITALRTG